MWSAKASPLDANNDDPKLALLTMISFSKINTYASTSSSLNQSISNEDRGGISVELTRYFTCYIFTFSEHLDVRGLVLLYVWSTNKSQYPIIFLIACDLLTPPINIVS